MKSRSAEKIIIITFYLLSSLSATVLNKYMMSIQKFSMEFLYLAIQSLFIVLLLGILSVFNIVNIKIPTLKNLWIWLPCSILLTLMIFTGIKSLIYLPISTFTLFKNFTLIFVAFSEKLLFRKNIGQRSYLAFLLMFLSSFIGDSTDFKIGIFGYGWIILNVLSTTAYTIVLKYTIDTEKTNDGESVLYNNLLSIPILLTCSFIHDKLDVDLFKSSNYGSKVIISTIISSFASFFIAYSTVWCLRLLSSTTLSMLGAVNKVLVSFSGMVFIGEENVSALKVLSMIVGSLAGLLYSKNIKKE